jgi:hypothetical protein
LVAPPAVIGLGFLSYLVFGLIQLIRYRRRVRAFDLEHGTNAGKQLSTTPPS